MGNRKVSGMGTPMDGLQQQINELNYKVGQLYHIVEQLSQQILIYQYQSEDLAQNTHNSPPKNGHYHQVMDHKDVLLDDRESNLLVTREGDSLLTTDLQVRRLTAQLTAAYNRIAVLEEQLVACRMMS